eukprot:m51a1_g4454 putative brca1-associated protein (581) ;mRNA; r:167912-170223
MFHLVLETNELRPCHVPCDYAAPDWASAPSSSPGTSAAAAPAQPSSPPSLLVAVVVVVGGAPRVTRSPGEQQRAGATGSSGASAASLGCASPPLTPAGAPSLPSPPPVNENPGDTAAESSSRAPFTTGNPAVETIRGVVHLLKTSSPSKDKINSTMLCALAVPSYISTSDFVRFICGYQKSIRYMKLLRNANAPSKYMVVMQFTCQQAADDFFFSYHGRRFNSLEPEECRLFYVTDIEVVQPRDAAPLFPPAGLTELPTCPVCLERMDGEATGLLTILCNHTFHSDCLAQWRDSGCPVCRYAQQPLGAESTCAECECDRADDLWICLLCGNVGCGRTTQTHALQHYKATGHAYALNLETKRVWDYAGDNYVHRVVQGKADGKLVAIESGKDDVALRLEMEYSRLVETQITAFERDLAEVKREHHKRVALLEEEVRHLKGSAASRGGAESRLGERVAALERDKEKAEKLAKSLSKRVSALTQRSEELEEMNRNLIEKQQHWVGRLVEAERQASERLAEKDRRIADLEGELHDVLFHLDAAQKVSGDTALQQGDLVVVPGAEPPAAPAANAQHHSRRPRQRK